MGYIILAVVASVLLYLYTCLPAGRTLEIRSVAEDTHTANLWLMPVRIIWFDLEGTTGPGRLLIYRNPINRKVWARAEVAGSPSQPTTRFRPRRTAAGGRYFETGLNGLMLKIE